MQCSYWRNLFNKLIYPRVKFFDIFVTVTITLRYERSFYHERSQSIKITFRETLLFLVIGDILVVFMIAFNANTKSDRIVI